MGNTQELVTIIPWTFIAQILNLFIQMYLIKRFLFKPINEVLQKRRELADQEIREARDAKEEADSLKVQYEEGLANARKEAQDIEYSVRRSWRMIRKMSDETYLREFFADGYDELEAAFAANDIAEITEILRETNGIVKRHARREVPVELDDKLKSYYLRFLEMSGQQEVIEILEELWSRDPSTFYNNA